MYKIRREQPQPKLPTGPNPLPPLDEFVVRKTNYNLSLQIPYGMYEVAIDPVKEVGFFEHAFNGIRGQFWLAGHVVIESEHLLPRDVRTALENCSLSIA